MAVAQLRGTVYDLFGSLSHVAVPLDATLTNLYSKLCPAASVSVCVHRLFELVYCAAESAGADETSQFPSAGIEPTILMVWPGSVLTISLNVTATLLAAAQPALVVVAAAVLVLVPVEDEGGLLPPSLIDISAQVR